MKIDPNEPAAPGGESYQKTDLAGHVTKCSKGPLYRGLTIRAHFAAMAMQGLLARNEDCSVQEFAVGAVQMADALIAELNKEETK